MATGKHGPSEITITVDDAQGGTGRAITPYVTDMNGVEITSVMQIVTAFGDTYKKQSPVGVKELAPITLHGFFDDTATVGPHVVLVAPDTTISDGTTATSRTVVIVFGNSKTFTCEAFLAKYKVMGKVGGLSEYDATLEVTGSFAWT